MANWTDNELDDLKHEVEDISSKHRTFLHHVQRELEKLLCWSDNYSSLPIIVAGNLPFFFL